VEPAAGLAAYLVRRSFHTGHLHEWPMWLRVLGARASGAVPGWVIARALDRVLRLEPPQA
jgi:hypothetical protein